MVIQLKEHQVEHVEKLTGAFSWATTLFDMSTMGLGKTYTSTECVLRLGLPNLFVVCPVSMEKKWREISKTHGVRNCIVTSFAGLRSVRGCQPKHGLLRKISLVGDEGETAEEIFEPTPKFTELVEEGLMMVIDEVHNLKNSSEQFRACKTLTDVINENKSGKSRCILLSGTPVDKEEQTIRMLRLMGLIVEKRLINYSSGAGVVGLQGAAELVNRCRERDPVTTDKILRESPATNTLEVIRICHRLFRDVVCRFWVSTMPMPRSDIDIDCKNGYYRVEDEKSLTHLQYYIEQLHKNSGFTTLTANVDGEGAVSMEAGKLGAIVKCLEGIEQSKLPIFERLVRKTLSENPSVRVCVGLNYVQRTLLNLMDRLKDLNPRMITGETPKTQRDKIVEEFQTPGSGCRLLIANVRCLSTGIDLDDKIGDSPRVVFASPNYTIVDLHQFSRRFLRTDSKSGPKFRFVYAECGRKERSILNALARKSQIMHEILKEQVNAGIRFPGEYEDEFEI
jgi:hypothetical protein